MELFAGVFVAQFHVERIDLIRLLLVAPVKLQLSLPVTILPANIRKRSKGQSRIVLNATPMTELRDVTCHVGSHSQYTQP